MPFQPAQWLGIFILGIVYFLFTSNAWASSVVINEFLPNPASGNNEWVEIYNAGGETVDLTGWYLEDAKDHKKPLDSLAKISSKEIKVLEGGSDGWLLNNGDETVCLKKADNEEVDCHTYSSDPGEEKSYGRETDGGSNWVTFNTPTKGGSNGGASPSPSPSPSPSSSPSSSSASYKINEVKDEDGNTLSSVKVYVDGVYLKHYAPETLTFCDGCSCDGLTACSFGDHTIKLEKSGYQDWEETKTINSGGSSYEVNPVMGVTSSESTSSSEDTASPSPQALGTTANTKTSKKTVLGQSIDSESMLGEFASFSGEVLGSTESGEKEAEENEEIEEGQNHNWLVPLGLSGSGLVLLGAASFPFVKPRVVSFLKKRKP